MPSSRVPMLLLSLLLAGCAHSEPADVGAVSPTELNAHPQTYHDRNVIVKGYLTIAPEAHNLYESEALRTEFERRWDADDPDFDPGAYQAYCLTIANPDALIAAREALNRTTIMVQGKFLANYLDGKIDLGACPLPTAILIDIDDLKRRYPTAFSP